jgi:hypothetical protein
MNLPETKTAAESQVKIKKQQQFRYRQQRTWADTARVSFGFRGLLISISAVLPTKDGCRSSSYAFRPLLDYLFVEADGLLGDSGPAEGLFYTPPPSISEALASLWIPKQSIDLEGKIPRKLFWISGKPSDRILIEGN